MLQILLLEMRRELKIKLNNLMEMESIILLNLKTSLKLIQQNKKVNAQN